MGTPQTDCSASTLDFTHDTVKILQFAYKLAQQRLGERAEKQRVVDADLHFRQYKPRDQQLVHRPCTEADGPIPKLVSPWRGPYIARSCLFTSGVPRSMQR